MRLKKLDKRNKGHETYKYMAVLNRSKEGDKFCEIRNWCWEQWGASSELDFYKSRNPAWAWNVDEYEVRIYIGSDKEYQWFLLRWHD